jgi:NTP pyrophosphatase (non-canonical NTP hydrolase)
LLATLHRHGPIWEYYCGNKDCPRTPADNLRDLFNPRCQPYRILDFTNGENQETIKSRDEVQSAVNLSFTKFEARAAAGEDPESDEGELGDIYINVLAYAAERGIDARAAMNKKMKKNRSRPTSHYLAKTEEKKKLGLKLC